VTNNYQKNMSKTSTRRGLAVPDEVTIAMGEIAEDIREGLLALAVGAGLQVMASLMEADVAAVCGPRGKHDPERTAVRHGRGRGSVTLGGRRIGVERPRMRGAGGGGEVPVPAYELFSRSEILGRMAIPCETVYDETLVAPRAAPVAVRLSGLTLMTMCGRQGPSWPTSSQPNARRADESDGRFVTGRGLMMADPCHKTVEPERERRDGTRRAESGELGRVDEQRQNR